MALLRASDEQPVTRPENAIRVTEGEGKYCYIDFAPGVPHFANLPFASLHFVGVGGLVVAHFTNLPLASRHRSAAKEGPEVMIMRAAIARVILRSMGFPFLAG
ncbi:hypothetical protein V6582_21130 (plasmid) [Agrobacterium vitis]|uniref:hypothetical protein n=1 Tax=Agrobacterium vitis TaxID=373 RepID=UPI0012E6FCB8|nr:hypothetical protein [Agrobacterium vitis]MVA27425.1 hypothetical protein [Agrobacterium vitis]